MLLKVACIARSPIVIGGNWIGSRILRAHLPPECRDQRHIRFGCDRPQILPEQKRAGEFNIRQICMKNHI